MAKHSLILLLLVASASLCGAQDAGAPVPAGQATSTTDNSSNSANQTARSEYSRPGSDALPFSLGFAGRKQVDISLFAIQGWDTNPPISSSTGPSSGWQMTPSFGGTLQLVVDKQSSQTTLSYNGRGVVYPDRDPMWTTYQDLGFAHSFKVGRWGFTAADSFTYSPNSPFGGYGFAVPGSSGGSGQVLNPNVPNQSILTSLATSYNNSVTGQLEYGITRRSSWTASGSYGTLRFLDSDFYNTNQVTGSTGYNYSLSASDTISATYSFSRIRYTNIDSQFQMHTAQLGYTHRLSSRMGIQLAGGPQIVDTANLGASDRRIQFSGTGSLLYNYARNSFSLTYFAGSTAGSGVLTGATTQSAQMSFGREWSKAWTTSLTAGYARNSGLVEDQTYNTVFVAPTLRRAITRNLGVTFNYSYQHQLTGSNCVALVCGNQDRNFVSFGIDYKFRPIRLE